MAKTKRKKVVDEAKEALKKKVEKKEIDYDYILAQMKEDRDTICRDAKRISELEQRIDRIVIAHTKCKSLKGM